MSSITRPPDSPQPPGPGHLLDPPRLALLALRKRLGHPLPPAGQALLVRLDRIAAAANQAGA